MKCKFGYYKNITKCDWQPLNEHTGQCSGICSTKLHADLAKDNKRVQKVRVLFNGGVTKRKLIAKNTKH